MKRTPWVLTALNAVLLLAAAIASYFKAVDPDPLWSPVWAQIASTVRSRSAGAIFFATFAVISLQVVRESIAVYQWRKDRVQRVLGKIVKNLLENDVKQNRCTLFQAVRGWRALGPLLWRTVWHQDDKAPIFADLARIRPWGMYLMVHARPAGAPNERSCAIFRVYRTRPNASEGVAGRVWDSDVYTVTATPEVPVGKLRHCRAFHEYDQNDPLRRFAEITNMKDAKQLRARTRTARHFHGTVITSADGSRKWGVLLVDSFRADSPFPSGERNGGRGHAFRERFNGYAETLSTMLT